jgi:hypothetical protein
MLRTAAMDSPFLNAGGGYHKAQNDAGDHEREEQTKVIHCVPPLLR